MCKQLLLALAILAIGTWATMAQVLNGSQIVSSWDAYAANYTTELNSTNTSEARYANLSMRAEKSVDLHGIIAASTTPAQASLYVNQLLNKIAQRNPQILEGSDFNVEMLDTNNNQLLNLVTERTQQTMAAVRPDLITYYMSYVSSDAEATQIINRYGTMESVNDALLAHPSWQKAIEAACLHYTANHVTWLRLLPILENDQTRIQLVERHPNDVWLLVAAFSTARSDQTKAEIGTFLAKQGISITTLGQLNAEAINVQQTMTNTLAKTQQDQSYWDNQFSDDDGAQARINDAFNHLRNGLTSFTNSLSAMNRSITNASTANAGAYSQTSVSLEEAWHVRGDSTGGSSVSVAQIQKLAQDQSTRELVIEQGNAQAQINLIRTMMNSDGTTQLTPEELRWLCCNGRNNEVLQEIEKIQNLPSSVRVAIIQNVRDNNQALGILTKLINTEKLNPTEMNALVTEGTTPTMLEGLLGTYRDLTDVRIIASCDYPAVGRQCVEMDPNDMETVSNVLANWGTIMQENDTQTRNVIAASRCYGELYASYKLGECESYAQAIKQNGQMLAGNGQIVNPTTGTLTTWHSLLSTANQLYGKYLNQTTAADLNTTNITDIQGRFWPIPPQGDSSAAEFNTLANSSVAAGKTVLNNQMTYALTNGNTLMGQIIYNQRTTLADGSISNHLVTVNTNTTPLTDLQNAYNGQTNAVAWNQQFINNPTQGAPNTIQSNVDAGLSEAVKQAVQLTEAAQTADLQKQRAEAIAANKALASGNPAGLSLSGVIARYESTSKEAATEKASLGLRTDLMHVDPQHPFWNTAKSQIGNQGPLLILANKAGQTVRTLRTSNGQYPEYINQTEQNPEYYLLGNKTAPPTITRSVPNPNYTKAMTAWGHHVWRYLDQRQKPPLFYYDYYQYREDMWQDKFYGTNANSIPSLQTLINQKAQNASIGEINSLLNQAEAAANGAKRQIATIYPTKYYQGTPEFANLTADEKLSGCIHQAIENNQTVTYFDRVQYATALWQAQYGGTGPGTVNYYQRLLLEKQSQ